MKYSREDHFKFQSLVESKAGRQIKTGEFFCILNGKTYTKLTGIANAIRHFEYNVKQFYDEFYKTDAEGICQYNSKFTTMFDSLLNGYFKTCGICPECMEERRNHQSESAKKHDVIQKKLVKTAEAMSKKTHDEKLKISQKRVATTLKNNGVDYFSMKAKNQWKRRSVEDVKLLVEKANATKDQNDSHTCGDKYTCSGRSIVLGQNVYFSQGFEDAVLKALYDLGIYFTTTKNVPKIPYSKNRTGKSRPDIFLPEMNLLIEVKSDWTFKINFEKIKEIGKNAIQSGFQYAVFAIKDLTSTRQLKLEDRSALERFLSMPISSQALNDLEKVQRLSGDSEYRPIAFGSGSARVPQKEIRNLEECDIVYSV